MTVFVTINQDQSITVMARLETKDAIGDMVRTVNPGEILFGRSYQWWLENGPGKKELLEPLTA